jgi:hypothetical protein
MPGDLQDLRLEYFKLHSRAIVHLQFLKHQEDLESLRLENCQISNEALGLISGLKNLKTLELSGWTENNSIRWNTLNNIHKLKKLRRLVVSGSASRNILDHLKYGISNDLEELSAFFEDASVESIQEMKRITPNLRKLGIYSSSSSATVNALLDTLENLESIDTWGEAWKIPSGKVYPKLKYLKISTHFADKSKPESLVKVFPNLEYLWISPTITTIPVLLKQWIHFLANC